MEISKVVTNDLGSFTIRPYQVNDERSVLELWKIAFRKEMLPKIWRWKFLENPYGLRMLVTIDQFGKVVVAYGGIPYRAIWNGEEIEIVHLMDVMSHPQVRKSGLFIHTVNAFIQSMCGAGKAVMLYGFPGKYHFDIGNKYLEYKRLGDFCYMNANIAEIHFSHMQGSLILISNPSEFHDFDWKRALSDYRITILRSQSFLEWRFFNHPSNQYSIYLYKDNHGKPVGYLVLALNDSTATIVDCIGPKQYIPFIIYGIALILSKLDMKNIQIWLPNYHWAVMPLQECHFTIRDEPLGILPTARVFDFNFSFDELTSNFFYCMCDGDLF